MSLQILVVGDGSDYYKSFKNAKIMVQGGEFAWDGTNRIRRIKGQVRRIKGKGAQLRGLSAKYGEAVAEGLVASGSGSLQRELAEIVGVRPDVLRDKFDWASGMKGDMRTAQRARSK